MANSASRNPIQGFESIDIEPERTAEDASAGLNTARCTRVALLVVVGLLSITTASLAVALAAVLRDDGGVGSGASSSAADEDTSALTLDEFALCGGNGIFEDGACVCFDCWRGATCGELVAPSECVIASAGGTPLLFEDYWVRHTTATIVIRPGYHIGCDVGRRSSISSVLPPNSPSRTRTSRGT